MEGRLSMSETKNEIKTNPRAMGVLMPIFSLPSNYGIGTLGEEAKRFADCLEKSKVTYWQVLPVGPTSYGDSPYQSFSSFAGNPYLIDLDMLIKDGYLDEQQVRETYWCESPEVIDYGNLYYRRWTILFRACNEFKKNPEPEYETFCRKNAYWLDDYTAFMAIKDDNDGKPWYMWEDDLKFKKPAAVAKVCERVSGIIEDYKIIQYFFDKQFKEFKAYLEEKKIKLIGDIPIYVAYDSVEVWSNPSLFELDKKLNQVKVAGCPPDAFDENGQLWGNPIYKWSLMKKDGYSWWKKRLGRTLAMYDTVRLDHFRGFASYYSIPAGDENAKNGKWVKGPGMDFFNEMKKEFGEMDIIAEDLGLITPDVTELLEETGYPGMKVIQFAHDSDARNLYLPHNYEKNCVVYTGTHDNDTTCGWFFKMDDRTRNRVRDYYNLSGEEGYTWGTIRGAMMSTANLCVIPMQDLLDLDSWARINQPSTTGTNWGWRMKQGAYTEQISSKLAYLNELFGRAPWEEESVQQ